MSTHILRKLLLALSNYWQKHGPCGISFGHSQDTDHTVIYFLVNGKRAFTIVRKTDGSIVVWHCVSADNEWLSWKITNNELARDYDALITGIEEHFLIKDINEKLSPPDVHSSGPYR